MKHIFLLKILFFCLIFSNLSAQALFFEKKFDVIVHDSLGHLIKQPWIGGLNATVMGEIDLNFDGKKDLVVYDQHAEKFFTFLNSDTQKNGLNDYRYAPEYETIFPKMTPIMNKLMWFQLVDFTGNGFPDLLVSNGLGGAIAFKNVSQDSTVKFERYVERVLPQQLAFSTLVRPHFIDLDGDGDLDLLVFGGMNGTSLHYYKNRSFENFGRIDTFDFFLADDMWGCFREGETSNQIILNTCDDDKNNGYGVRGTGYEKNASSQVHLAPRTSHLAPKHGEGSTIFAIDLNNDGLFDLLLADGGYPNITALFNGGTHEKARITHYDTAFPRQSARVNLMNTPAVSAIDVDNCGVKELIFSPFNAKDFLTESYASNWVYKNMSPSGNADFQLISQRFLQDEMLDFGMGSFPTIVDIDGNGLLDIVVGNYGKIDSVWLNIDVWESRMVADLTLLKNIGTATQPKFQIHPLNLIPKLDFAGAVPTFGDITGDGKLDLLIGTETGEIRWYKQQADVFSFVLESENILDEDIGNFLAPQLIKISENGLFDLVVGSQLTMWWDPVQMRNYSKSSITYLKNIGTRENPEFTKITDSLGRVDVTNRERSINGYSKPHFFKNSDGKMHLFCGNEDGKILHYIDIENNLFDGGTFHRLDDVETWHATSLQTVSEGSFTAVAVADFNGDGLLDMVVGNHRGGLTIFFGTDKIPVKIVDSAETRLTASLRIYPNPVTDELRIINYEWKSGDIVEIFDLSGRRAYLKQINSSFFIFHSSFSIDVSHLTNGVYILKIGNQVAKFVKN